MTDDTRLFLGVDGGGSKTEALLGDAAGHVIGRGHAGPANPYFVPPASALAAVLEAIRAARQPAGPRPIAHAAICVPGLRRHFDAERLAAKALLPPDALAIEGDDWAAFYGALGGACGAVVLAGTGSFALGMNHAGERLSLGGWGPLLGDEGSGFAIGRAALRAVIAEHEQRGPATRLTPLVLAHFGLTEPGGLRACIYGPDGGQKGISALAPLVGQAADEGDGVARAVIAGEARNLAELAIAAIRRLGLDTPEYALALTGGLSRLGPLLTAPFAEAVRRECPTIRIRPPRFTPAVGALLLALQAGDVELDETLLANLERS